MSADVLGAQRSQHPGSIMTPESHQLSLSASDEAL